MAGEKILVVDDDYRYRESVERILSGAGYEVATVMSGMGAVEYLKENDARVIVTDNGMYPIDGCELLRLLKDTPLREIAAKFRFGKGVEELPPVEKTCEIPVILMSSDGSIFELAREDGAYDCVHKSLLESELVGMVERALSE